MSEMSDKITGLMQCSTWLLVLTTVSDSEIVRASACLRLIYAVLKLAQWFDLILRILYLLLTSVMGEHIS